MNMTFAAFVLIATIACLSASYVGQRPLYGNFYRPFVRQRNVYPPITTPVSSGTTPMIITLSEEEDRQAAKKGVRIPSDKCIISWEQFKEHIDGQDLIDTYGINNDDKIVPGQFFKLSVIWKAINETTARRKGSVWNTAMNGCMFLDGLFKRIDDSLTIFQGPRGESQTVYFVSSNPEKYIIIHVCFESQKIQDGRCPSTLTHFMVRDQRDKILNDAGIRVGPTRLNDIPWTDMEDDAKYCLGQMFVDDTDPQMYWAWKNQACPVQGTDGFEKGLSQQMG